MQIVSYLPFVLGVDGEFVGVNVGRAVADEGVGIVAVAREVLETADGVLLIRFLNGELYEL